AFTDRRARMALAFGVAGLALSFGPSLPGYATLYTVILPLQGVRNVARFGYLAIFAVAILAGFGLALVRQRWHAARWLGPLTLMTFAAVNAESLAAPVGYVRADPI